MILVAILAVGVLAVLFFCWLLATAERDHRRTSNVLDLTGVRPLNEQRGARVWPTDYSPDELQRQVSGRKPRSRARR